MGDIDVLHAVAGHIKKSVSSQVDFQERIFVHVGHIPRSVRQGLRTLLKSPGDTKSPARSVCRLKECGFISSAAEEAVGLAVGRDKEDIEVLRGRGT